MHLPDLYDGRVADDLDTGMTLMRDIGWEAITGRAREAVELEVHHGDDDPLLPASSMKEWIDAAHARRLTPKVRRYAPGAWDVPGQNG